MAVREIPYFYGRSRKNDRPIRKVAGFYGRLKETCSNRPSGGAIVLQNLKEKSQILENQRFAIEVPGAELLTLYSIIVDCSINVLNINDIQNYFFALEYK